jgi:hypothetical protein
MPRIAGYSPKWSPRRGKDSRRYDAGFWPYGERLHAPRSSVTATAAMQYSVSHIYVKAPPWPWHGLFAGFLNAALGPGSGVAETDGGAATVEDCAVSVNGGAWQRLTIDGATGRAMAAGDAFATDILPISGRGGEIIYIRTAANVPVGNVRVGGYRLMAALSEGGEYSTASLAAKVMSGAPIANAAAVFQYVFGPTCIMFGGKPAGQSAVGKVGDSLDMGVAEATASVNTHNGNGAQGFLHRTLASVKVGYINLTKDGARAQDITGTGVGQGFARRKALLDALAARGGNYPITRFVNELATNDSTSVAATWASRVAGCIDTLRGLGVPVSLVTNLVSCSSATDKFQTTSGQTISANYDPTAGTMLTLETTFAGWVGGRIDAWFNVRPITDGTYDNASGAVAGKYRVDVCNMVTSLSVGANAGQATITTATPLEPGMAITVGGATAEGFLVYSVAGNVATLSGALVSNYAAGAAVRQVFPSPIDGSNRGLHYSTHGHAYISQRLTSIPSALHALGW